MEQHRTPHDVVRAFRALTPPGEASVEDVRIRDKAAWDPDRVLVEIPQYVDSAREKGWHLWDSTPRHQLYAAASWLASIRRVIGSELTSTIGIIRPGSITEVPKEIVEITDRHLTQAQHWHDFRASLPTAKDPSIPDTFDAKMDWPDAASLPREASNALLHALFSLINNTGLNLGIIDQKLHYVLNEVNGPHRKNNTFHLYIRQLEAKRSELQERINRLAAIWDHHLDTATPLGNEVYGEAVDIIESLIAWGLEALVPSLSDKNYGNILRSHEYGPSATQTTLPLDTSLIEDILQTGQQFVAPPQIALANILQEHPPAEKRGHDKDPAPEAGIDIAAILGEHPGTDEPPYDTGGSTNYSTGIDFGALGFNKTSPQAGTSKAPTPPQGIDLSFLFKTDD